MDKQGLFIVIIKPLTILLSLLSFCGNIIAQGINPENITLYGATLMYEDSDRLTKLTDDEIRSLDVYGFDYNKFFKLRTEYIVSTISIFAGSAMLGIGGFIGRKGQHVIASTALEIAGPILAAAGMYFESKSSTQIFNMVGEMKESPQFGFTPSGFGLVYNF